MTLRTGRNLLPHGPAGRQHRTGLLEGVSFECRWRPPRRHRLWPRLDDVDLPIVGILGPLDVHGHWLPGLGRVVVFDRDGISRNSKHLRITDGEALALAFWYGNITRASLAIAIDHAHLLPPQRPAEDGAMAETERRFVHVEFVGINCALDYVLAEPVDGGDEHNIAKPGLGVERKGHSARGRIGPDHLHDSD